MAQTAWSAWWRTTKHPPPAAWSYAFEELTSDDTADEWALAAAIFIAQYRRRHSQGPTFRELFEHLLPESGGIPSRLPTDWDASDRRRAANDLRRHVAIEWRRRGYIGYDKQVARSLRVGPRFRAQSRARNTRARESSHERPGESLANRVESEDSLSADAAHVLLRVTPTVLRRLTRRGYLHAVGCGSQLRYPSWQFAGRPKFKVVPGASTVVPAIPKHWATVTINSFMTTPNRHLEGDGGLVSPVDWLMRGNDPRRVADALEASEVSSARRAARP